MTNAEDTRAATGLLAVDLPGSVVALAAWSAWTRLDLLPTAAPRPETAGARVCAEG